MAGNLLTNIPALPPPPGVVSNFENPSSEATSTITVTAVFLAPMLAMVMMRVYTKGWIIRSLGWDDYTCVLAALSTVAHAIIVLLDIPLGYERHAWDIRAISLTPAVVRLLTSLALLYPISMFLIKLSILLFYIRLFGVDRKVRYLIWFGISFQALFYTAIVSNQIAALIECASTSALRNTFCKNQYAIVLLQGIVNVITDFYVLALPISSVMKLQLPFQRKLGLLAVFMTGLIACLVSVVRLGLVANHLRARDVFFNPGFAEVTVVEMDFGLIAACMPALPAFFNKSKLVKLSTYSSLWARLLSSRGRSGANLAGRSPRGKTDGVYVDDDMQMSLHDARYFKLGRTDSARAIIADRKGRS